MCPESPRDVEELLMALEPPPAPERAPAWPVGPASSEPSRAQAWWRTPRRWVLVPVVAGALGLLAVLLLPPASDPALAPVRQDGLRGEAPPALPELDLQLAVQRDGLAQRVDPEDQLRLQDRVLFRVSSTTPTTVHLWVEGPAGFEDITAVSVESQPVELRLEEGLLAWELDRAGSYVFVASASARPACTPPTCARVALEVR
jgi:hypothetical protein